MARRVTFAMIAQPQTEPLQGAAELTDGQKRYVETDAREKQEKAKAIPWLLWL